MPLRDHPAFSRTYLLLRKLLLILVAVLVIVVGLVAWPILQTRLQSANETLSHSGQAVSAYTVTPSASPTPEEATIPPSPTPLPASPAPPLQFVQPANSTPLEDGAIVLAISTNGQSHLYLYQAGAPDLLPLSGGDWDDACPSFSPDGRQLAFASNRDGPWDLYLLDLQDGSLRRVTESPEYDSCPSFSPDGRWLAYETYQPDAGNLEIAIRSLQDDTEPIMLSDDPAADYAPTWSPEGRQVAFVSDRSGEPEIWLADLDRVEDRFLNLSHDQTRAETRPVWSPDGQQLAWGAISEDGLQEIFIWQAGENRPLYLGSGSWPAWHPQAQALVSGYETPNDSYLTAYMTGSAGLALAPLSLNGRLIGLTWGATPPTVRERLLALTQEPGEISAPPLWLPALSAGTPVPGGRQQVIPLDGVDAPYAALHDLVDESFRALRNRVARETGWDFLSNLENAFVPLTAPLSPGMQEDWLYTGRAFAFNPLPVNAGWVAVLREDYGPETYWRVFLRARYQDGSQGQPLHARPWDFSARYSGDPRTYEEGGSLASAVPAGYWVDFTELARAYGWERLPALNTWRSAATTARFNEFVLRDGLDWKSAMLELYPPEALIEPTRVVPTAGIPLPTRRPTQTATPTRTPWPTHLPTATSAH